ncbi:hypothetical protein PVAND_004608 [Polypedilum vanderplanki]|uniref:Uncharacterized protein n=1 Tax=Polypedilum vanderplanki TaxID=319348 RepID=A0A9J6BZL5_POLVA|nr:hypothetical protein PVAND_004608 [Polypedilum vanderplanki]
MKVIILIVSLTTLVALTSAQRGHYAGSRPINDGIKGEFPDVQQPTNLGNRFTDNSIGSGQTQPVNSNPVNPNLIPQYHPYNNMNLFNYFNQLPQHQQPFWFLNNEAIQGHLNRQQPQPIGMQSQPIGVQPLQNRGSFLNRNDGFMSGR